MTASAASAAKIHLKDTTEVVAWIAATVARSISAAGIPGHDLHTVMDRMTTNQALDTIRTAYTTWAGDGKDRPEGITKIGVRLIQEYRRTYGI